MISEKIKDDILRTMKEVANDMLEAAARLCDAEAQPDGDCQSLGPMDPETGVSECSRRGGDCLCAERMELAEKLADKIRTLKQ